MRSISSTSSAAGGSPDPRILRRAFTGRIGASMPHNPFDDEIGAFIQEKISQESWEGWMEMSIKLINELRLDLGEPSAQQIYEEHMRDYLNLPDHLFSWAAEARAQEETAEDGLIAITGPAGD